MSSPIRGQRRLAPRRWCCPVTLTGAVGSLSVGASMCRSRRHPPDTQRGAAHRPLRGPPDPLGQPLPGSQRTVRSARCHHPGRAGGEPPHRLHWLRGGTGCGARLPTPPRSSRQVEAPVVLARHLAPLVTADVLSCWCPLGAPCHADTLCDLVGRLRTGDLVPGLVATPDVCGGALRIDGTEWAVAQIASNVSSWLDAGMCRNDMVLQTAATYSLDPDLVRLAAQVGGAL